MREYVIMIELSNNLSIKQLNGLFYQRKKTSFLYRIFFATVLFLIYFKMLIVLGGALPHWLFLVSMIVCCFYKLFTLYYTITTNESLYERAVSREIEKMVFSKEEIRLFFKDHVHAVLIDKYTNSSLFLIAKNEKMIYVVINSYFILSANTLDEQQWKTLEELFQYYKTNECIHSFQNEKEVFECHLQNHLFMHILYIIHDKIKNYSSFRKFDIVIFIFSIIDLFTVRLHLYVFFVARLIIFLMFAIHIANARHKCEKESGYISKQTKVKFTEKHYMITVNEKIISSGDIDNIMKVEKFDHFYMMQSICDRMFITEQDYLLYKNAIENIE